MKDKRLVVTVAVGRSQAVKFKTVTEMDWLMLGYEDSSVRVSLQTVKKNSNIFNESKGTYLIRLKISAAKLDQCDMNVKCSACMRKFELYVHYLNTFDFCNLGR